MKVATIFFFRYTLTRDERLFTLWVRCTMYHVCVRFTIDCVILNSSLYNIELLVSVCVYCVYVCLRACLPACVSGLHACVSGMHACVLGSACVLKHDNRGSSDPYETFPHPN